ncbi:uncharacterized protein ARMOST_12645 [Armillaria ostoyae]|uniref:HNH nuclease domain-containing protein n=1 Tax=Armillaria ostoyae TaxID=47428 RepID=A0A284RKI5_ARMOS|nr:uncharacterized protein ARMOST_12645 [Armillaria ostoyae]
MSHLPQGNDFTARALPANPFLLSDLHAAFNLCLGLESRNLVPLSDPPAVLCARVLGFTLIEAPSRSHIAESINGRSSDDQLLALGKYYIQRLLRVFKAAKGPTPPSEHPSCPDLDDVQELRKYITRQASLNHSTAKQAALVRDGFHCMIKTHLYDAQYFERNWSTIIAQDPGWDVGTLRCTHIFPEGLNLHLEVPHEWVASVWSAIEALPLPSPAYLAIHAACCRVAHLSGAADYVEKVFREEEEIRERVGGMCILAEDGSSMDLFEQYIAAVQVV